MVNTQFFYEIHNFKHSSDNANFLINIHNNNIKLLEYIDSCSFSTIPSVDGTILKGVNLTFIMYLIFIMIIIILLTLGILKMFNIDDDNSSLVLGSSSRRSRSRSLSASSTIVSPIDPNGGDNGDDDEDNRDDYSDDGNGNIVRNTVGEMLAGLYSIWIYMKREDAKSADREESTRNGTPTQEERINHMSDKDVKNLSVPIKKPIGVNTDFEQRWNNSNSILTSSNVLYHPDSKHYDPIHGIYNHDNVIRNQNIFAMYTTTTGMSAKILLNDIIKGVVDPRNIANHGYTMQIWGDPSNTVENPLTIPPRIRAFGDSSPIALPTNIAEISDPYLLSALKVMTLETFKDADLYRGFTPENLLDVKKLNDLKTAFLTFKAAGNADLNWEKLVSYYAFTYSDEYQIPTPLARTMEEHKAYMQMIDFVNVVQDCRERNDHNFVPYWNRIGIHNHPDMYTRRSR